MRANGGPGHPGGGALARERGAPGPSEARALYQQGSGRSSVLSRLSAPGPRSRRIDVCAVHAYHMPTLYTYDIHLLVIQHAHAWTRIHNVS